MPGATGTLTLYIDQAAVGSGDIITQPGFFCVVGDGICVGRADGSADEAAFDNRKELYLPAW